MEKPWDPTKVSEGLRGRLESLVAQAAEAVRARQVVLLMGGADTGGPQPLAHWGNGQPSESYIPLAQQMLSQGGELCPPDQQPKADACPAHPQTPIIATPIHASGVPPGLLVALLPETDSDQLPTRMAQLRSLADVAGGLLETTILREELRQKEAQVREMVQATLDAQEAERQRISLEIHDRVTQTLASAFHHLQALQEATQEDTPAHRLGHRATALVRQAIRECREVINDLQPATLHPLGLVAAIRQEVRHMERDAGWKISLHVDPVRLPPNVETNLYRIMREALANVSKHADTSRVWVRLERLEDRIALEVKDRGRGFDPQAVEASPGGRKGLGLLSMRKRAELLRGKCTVESGPQRGTTVRVEIPICDWEDT